MSSFKKLLLRKNSFQNPDALARLTPLGSARTVIVIVAILAVIYFAVGYFSHYWRNSDMDFMVLYSAFLLNDGKPQAYFDHPGYLTIVLAQAWLWLLHQAGMLNAYALSAIPAPGDASFDHAMTAAIRALRAEIWIIGMAIAVAFYVLMRRIVTNARVAVLAFVAFVFSGGVADHLHLVRSEMIAAGFVVIALLVLILAARHVRAGRPVFVGIAAMLCVLAMANKVQVIFLVAALPVLALAFGTQIESAGFWRDRQKSLSTLTCLALVVICLAWEAWPLIQTGLNPSTLALAGLKPLLPTHIGLYQTIFMFWIFAGIAAYAMMWRVAFLETAAAVLCLAIGGAFALLALKLQYNSSNAVALLNPLERMLTFVPVKSDGGTRFAGLILNDVREIFLQYAFFVHPVPRPTVFLLWVIVPGIVYAAYRGHTRLAVQTALLVATGMAMDAVDAQRQIKLEYWVFSDSFFIIAGALLLDGIVAFRESRWTYPIGALLIVLNVGIGVSEPLKHMLQVQGPRTICALETEYTPLMKLPWCTVPPLRNPLDNAPSLFAQTFKR